METLVTNIPERRRPLPLHPLPQTHVINKYNAGILEFQAGVTLQSCLQIISEPAVPACVGSCFHIANSGWERLTKIGESKKHQEQNYFVYRETSYSLKHLFRGSYLSG